jgi:hypothetical protein
MNEKNRRILFVLPEVVGIPIGFYLFYVIVTSSLSVAQRDFITWFVNENAILLASILLFFILAYLIPGWPGRSIRWVGLATFLGVILRGYWLIKRTEFFQVYGFLPIADASEYFENAQRLLLGFPAQGTTIGRPLFTSLFAGLLWLTHMDLLKALMVLVILTGFSIYLLGESTHKHFGTLPASIMIAFTVMFYRNYLGAISSESLGLIFCCVGWAILFETFQRPSIRIYLAGTFFLTVALITRAGPFFIIPFILLAFLIFYRAKPMWIQYILGTVVVFAAGFGLNSFVLGILTGNKSYLFPNYLYSLYGMAAGGKGWGYIKQAHPDIMALTEPLRTQQLYQITLDLIKSHPWVFIINLIKQYWYFVLYGNTSVFSYLFTSIDWYNILLMVLLYGLCIWTVVLLIKNRKELKHLVLLGAIVGIVLSVPFVPPQDESDMRAFAVVIPIMALVPAFSLDAIIRYVFTGIGSKRKLSGVKKTVLQEKNVTHYATIVLAVIILGGSILPIFSLQGIARPINSSVPVCPSGTTPYVWNYLHHNSVSIQTEMPFSSENYIHAWQARSLIHNLYFSGRTTLFKAFQDGTTITENVNYLDGNSAWVITPSDIYKAGDRIYSGCGNFVKSDDIYLLDYITIVSANHQ